MKKLPILTICFLLANTLFSQTLTSSDLPIVVINTNSQDILNDPKIMADMGIIYNGPGVRNNTSDTFTEYSGKIGIETRGQSSQQFPMKSYGFELWDAAGKSVNKSLFGLPSESDWILYAPYNEKTLAHNFLAYTISREMGHWAANCRYVEVIINNEYRGIYVLMEKIKRNNGRVNVTKLNSTDITGDAVTGGYIFSIDKDANAWYSAYKPNPSTNAAIRFSYVYPKDNSIVPEQSAYLKSYVDSFENALKDVSYQDKLTGWRKFANEGTFIDFFLVNEISKNVDGYRISTYFNKDRASKGGKINAGPVWDYDLGFRNADYCEGDKVEGWAYRFNNICGSDSWQVPFWWDRFMSDTAFTSNLRCRWNELRATTLSTQNLFHLIDSIVTLTTEARTRHFNKWPVLGQYVWPNPQPIATTYDGEIQNFKSWLTSRMEWMDKNIPTAGACAGYPANITQSIIVTPFPNPYTSGQKLRIQSRIQQAITIRAFDAGGKEVFTKKQNLGIGYNELAVPDAGWSPGIYFWRIETSAAEKILIRTVKQ